MAREFTGSPNALIVGDVPSVDITGTQLTVHAWIRPSVFVNGSYISKWSAGNGQYTLSGTSGGLAGFGCGDTLGEDGVNGATVLPAGGWYAHGGVKDGTGAGAIRVYVNGVQDGSATSNRVIANMNESFAIGVDGNGGYTRAWIAEVAIWNLALTPAEMASLAAGTPALQVQPGNLRGYWPLCGVANPEPDLKNGAQAVRQGTVPAVPHPFLNGPYCGQYASEVGHNIRKR